MAKVLESVTAQFTLRYADDAPGVPGVCDAPGCCQPLNEAATPSVLKDFVAVRGAEADFLRGARDRVAAAAAGDTGASPPVVAGLLDDLRGLDPAKAKEFIRAILPLLEMVVASTPNPFDNLAIAVLKRWANS